MAESRLIGVIRGFVDALEKKDEEKALSFLTEDIDWVSPEGTFKGHGEVKTLLKWWASTNPDMIFTDTGIGIMVNEKEGIYEYIVEGTFAGKKYRSTGICIYEFNGEKIQRHRTYYDRLSVGKQVAKGWFAKTVVNAVVNQSEKGLR